MSVPLQKGMNVEAKSRIISSIIKTSGVVAAAVIGLYAVKLQIDTSGLEQRISALEAENQSLREENTVPPETPSVDTTALEQRISELETTVAQQRTTIAERDATIADLRVQLENSDRSATSAGSSNSNVIPVTPLSSTPDIWLCDMDDFASDGVWYRGKTISDNLNEKHAQCIDIRLRSGYVLYHLDGKYRTLTGIFFREYNDKNRDGTTKLQFYDNETGQSLEFYDPQTGTSLGDTLQIGKADMPISFAVNVSNIQVLKLQESGNCSYAAIGETGLWLA